MSERQSARVLCVLCTIITCALLKMVGRSCRALLFMGLPQDNDWDAFLALVNIIHGRSVPSDIRFSDRKLAPLEMLVRNLQSHECILVAKMDGHIAISSAGKYLFGKDIPTTTHLFGVDPHYCGPFRLVNVFVKMLRKVTAWPKTLSARQFAFRVSAGYALKQI